MELKKGELLLAEPFMLDPNFRRTVVLMCENSQEGSLGLVINRQLTLTVGDVIPELDFFHANLYYGGPVEQETLQFLHTYGDIIDDSKQIAENLYWNGDFEQLKTYMNIGKIKPNNIRFYLGYSGWDATQLKEEMKENSWIVAPTQNTYIFAKKPNHLWREVLRDMGDDHYRIMSHFPEYPALN